MSSELELKENVDNCNGRGPPKRKQSETNIVEHSGTKKRTHAEINLPGNQVDTVDTKREVFAHFTEDVPLQVNDLISLLEMAEKYNLPAASKGYCDILFSKLDPENVLEVRSTARKCGIANLLSACDRFINRHAEQVFKSGEFKNLDNEVLGEFLKRDSLNASESTIYAATLKWATTRCEDKSQPPTGESIRAALGDNKYLIRFSAMNTDEFAIIAISSPGDDGLLTMKEKLTNYNFISVSPTHKTLIEEDPPFPTTARKFSPQLLLLGLIDQKPTVTILTRPATRLYLQELTLSVNKTIYLRGVIVFGIRKCRENHGGGFRASLSAHENCNDPKVKQKVVSSGKGSLVPPSSSISDPFMSYFPFLLVFDDDFTISPGKTYTIKVEVDVIETEDEFEFHFFSGPGAYRNRFDFAVDDFAFTLQIHSSMNTIGPCLQISSLVLTL